MNSIAIWYEQTSNDRNTVIPELDVHVNHWKLKFKKNYFVKILRSLCTNTLGKKWKNLIYHESDYFMDFGVKVKNGAKIKNVCFFIPYTFFDGTSLIEDIGNKLIEKRLIMAVFNEPYNTLETNDPKYFTVVDKSHSIFNVYRLDISNDIKLEQKFNGTIIRIPFKQYNSLPTYYRFRLKALFVKKLSYVYSPSNSFLESVYSNIEVIDFRINDTRNLDVSLVEYINSQDKFNIRLVHYFVMRSVKDEYVVSNQELTSVRQLEDKTWESYVNKQEYIYGKSFAYHLKKKVEKDTYIDEFSAVLKFRFEDNKLLWYFFYLLLFAVFTEVVGSGIYDCLKLILNKLNGIV